MTATRDRTPTGPDEGAVEALESASREVPDPTALAPLVDRLADARVVLLGEASHGTSEYYQWRSWLSAQLLVAHDFDFVAVEGDWTDCFQVNRFVKGLAPDETPRSVCSRFDRWPTWMWANWEVLEFVDWLATANESRETDELVGFYGLDVYSLFESMAALVETLESIDPDAAAEAREAYRCFEPYGEDAQEYARAIRFAPESCEDAVVDVLATLTADGVDYGDAHPDERFGSEQNALVARNAEAYYRAMVDGNTDSWNVRDRHMTDTLHRLLDYHGDGATGIVWAHNTHVGDARATSMERRGRHNIGQLAREEVGRDDVAIVGFGSHRGDVIAGEAWGAPTERMAVPPARDGSVEDLFHRTGGRNRLLVTEDLPTGRLEGERGNRAIGVVYDPAHEGGNYVPTVLPERYDAFVHLEETGALHPLDTHADRGEVPELYPWGL